MNTHEMPNWYEAGLPVRERKRRGHFSTPPELVEQILDACGYTSARDLSLLRVLDPACGSGNFLAAAARRLLLSGQPSDLSTTELLAAIQRNLWGFDPDPVACFLAEMQIRTLLANHLHLSHVPNLHIHQGDGLALPWYEYQGIDLFLANPPYLAAKNTDLSGYHSARQRGQADSYLLFMDLALQVVRPDGWLALVLPDPVLARANAARERQRFLSETTIHHLWHLAGVFSAHVGAVVLIAQKRSPTHFHQISWIRGHWLQSRNETRIRYVPIQNKQMETPVDSAASQPESPKRISLTLLSMQPHSEFCYLLGEVQNPLIRPLHAQIGIAMQETLTTLGDLVQIRRGEELSKSAPLLQERQPENETQGRYPVLRGGSDVRPYVVPNARYWLAREHMKKPLERYLRPKLVVVKSTDRLQATLDLHGHVVLQTLYLLSPLPAALKQFMGESEDPLLDGLYFLLALLNSRLLKEYVYVLHTAYKWVQPQIEQHVLAHLPIPKIEPVLRADIIERAKQLYACSTVTPVVELEQQWKALYEQQEQAIGKLYTGALPSSFVVSST